MALRRHVIIYLCAHRGHHQARIYHIMRAHGASPRYIITAYARGNARYRARGIALRVASRRAVLSCAQQINHETNLGGEKIKQRREKKNKVNGRRNIEKQK